MLINYKNRANESCFYINEIDVTCGKRQRVWGQLSGDG